MVHITDEGSLFDAPIEAVWKYLNTPEVHGPAHPRRRNLRVTPVPPNSVVLSQEQEIGGQWHTVSNRISLFPPLGYAVEFLEGPMAGSKSFTIFSPRGPQTAVTVVGDFVSKLIPESQLHAAVLGLLGQM